MRIYFCLECPDRFCELDAEELDEDEILIQELLNQALCGLPFSAIIDKLKLDFNYLENTYTIQILTRYNDGFEASVNCSGDIGFLLEDLFSKVLLQIFWEIS